MDGEQLFWVRIWTLVGAVVLAIVVCVTIYNVTNMTVKTSLLLKATEPMAAACAYEEKGNTFNNCTIYLSKK